MARMITALTSLSSITRIGSFGRGFASSGIERLVGSFGAIEAGGEGEDRADADAARDLDAAAHRHRQVLADREAEAGALGVAAERAVDPVEPLEDMRDRVGGDAAAGILD